MNRYQKIFGSGPVGSVISLGLLLASMALENRFGGIEISDNQQLRYCLFGALTAITISIIAWSIFSLPLGQRGNRLVTKGAFRYFRHPLYGAVLSFFNFGLAFLLNNWIYILWAALQHPVWHWVVRVEETMMRQAFPAEYERYSRQTGRFFPRLQTKRTSY